MIPSADFSAPGERVSPGRRARVPLRPGAALFAATTAIEFWRFCFLQWTNRLGEALPGNLSRLPFLLYCLGMVLGMVLTPLLLRGRGKGGPAAYAFMVLCAAGLGVLGPFVPAVFAAALCAPTAFCASAALFLCIRKAAESLVPGRIGRFIGGMSALMAIVGAALFTIPALPMPVIMGIACAVLLLTLALRRAIRVVPPAAEAPGEKPPLPRAMVVLCVSIACLFCILSSLSDSMLVFGKAYDEIPRFQLYVWIYYALMYLVAGWLFDKRAWFEATMFSFMSIGLGQALSFFSGYAFMAIPYFVLTAGAAALLEVFVIAFPLLLHQRFAGFSRFVGAGYVCFYLFYMLDAALIALMPAPVFGVVLGIIMVLTLLAMALTFLLLNHVDRYRLKQAAEPEKPVDYARAYGLTPREAEVLGTVVEGLSTAQIAARLCITERTVKHHIGQILKKTGTKNRVELILTIKH